MSTLSPAQPLTLEQPSAAPDAAAMFKAHHGFVWRVLPHLGVAPADRDDALQEVFVVVHRRLHEYREHDKVRAWLYAIATRVAKQMRRGLYRRREDLTDTPPELPQPASQPCTVLQRESLALAERLLAALPPKQRAVFLLYEVEQMPMAEVALAVGCPLATAHARLRLARERVLGLVARAERRGEVP